MLIKERKKNLGFKKKKKVLEEVTGKIKDRISKEDVEDDLGFNALGIIFKLKFDEGDYEIDLKKLLLIKQKTILQDSEELPLKILQLGLIINKIKVKISRLEMKKKIMYSKIFKELRAMDEYKKITDTQISKFVEQDVNFVEIVKKIDDYNFQSHNLDQVFWALKDKLMIVSKLLPTYISQA